MQRGRQNYWILIGFIIGIEGLGGLSSLTAGNVRGHYQSLNLPSFSPPGVIFGIVWPALYLLVAISGYLVFMAYRQRKISVAPMVWYALQLVINFFWLIVFFSWELYWTASLMILIMDILVIMCIIRFYLVSRLASWAMVPNLAWILFATYLSFGVAILN